MRGARAGRAGRKQRDGGDPQALQEGNEACHADAAFFAVPQNWPIVDVVPKCLLFITNRSHLVTAGSQLIALHN
jgi:hypothetical protein